jgi:hypothetical protein
MHLTVHARDRIKERIRLSLNNTDFRTLLFSNKDKIRKHIQNGRITYTLLVSIHNIPLLFVMSEKLDVVTVTNPLDHYGDWCKKVNRMRNETKNND